MKPSLGSCEATTSDISCKGFSRANFSLTITTHIRVRRQVEELETNRAEHSFLTKAVYSNGFGG